MLFFFVKKRTWLSFFVSIKHEFLWSFPSWVLYTMASVIISLFQNLETGLISLFSPWWHRAPPKYENHLLFHSSQRNQNSFHYLFLISYYFPVAYNELFLKREVLLKRIFFIYLKVVCEVSSYCPVIKLKAYILSWTCMLNSALKTSFLHFSY